jgi:hypothetical protein
MPFWAEIFIFSQVVSQALLISTSERLPKPQNLFEISTRYCSTPSITFHFLLNELLHMSSAVSLFTQSQSLPNFYSLHTVISQFAVLKDQTLSTLDYHILSTKYGKFDCEVFATGYILNLYIFWWGSLRYWQIFVRGEVCCCNSITIATFI